MPDDNVVDGTALGRTIGRIEKARVEGVIIAKADSSSSKAAAADDSCGNDV